MSPGKKYARPYVGIRPNGNRDVFRSAERPTVVTHPDYLACIGPFRTMRAARAVAEPGSRYLSVSDAEWKTAREATHKETARRYFRAHVTYSGAMADRKLLGEVVDTAMSPDSVLRLRVRFFNGEPWPFDPLPAQVEVLRRD
jgi:hypothetical protein